MSHKIMEIDEFTRSTICIDEPNPHVADYDIAYPHQSIIISASVFIDKFEETTKIIQHANKALVLGGLCFILCVILIVIFISVGLYSALIWFSDKMIAMYCFIGISCLTMMCGAFWSGCLMDYPHMRAAWSFKGSSLYFNTELKHVEYIKYCIDYGDNNERVTKDNIENIHKQGPIINILNSKIICSFDEIENIKPVLTDKINRYKVEIFIKNKTNWKTPKDYHVSTVQGRQEQFKSYFANVLSHVNLSSKLSWNIIPESTDYDPFYD
eukprot:162328_1